MRKESLESTKLDIRFVRSRIDLLVELYRVGKLTKDDFSHRSWDLVRRFI